MPHHPRGRWLRRLLILAVGLVLAGGLALVILRQAAVRDLARARAEFERTVGPLTADAVDAEAEPSAAMEPFRQARELSARGRLAREAGRLDEGAETVAAIEALRLEILADEPRLVELLLSQASGRLALDLAAALLEEPGLPPAVTGRLLELFGAENDHLGVDAALVAECELMLAGTERTMREVGFGGRAYHWLRGASDTAAAVRLYHGLYEAMHEPVPDVVGHLRERTRTRPASFRPVAAFLIPNLESAAWDHRYQTTSRRLIRLAARGLLVRESTGTFPELRDLPAGDAVGTVTGGPATTSPAPDGGTVLSFSEAAAHQAARAARPATAPPRFPLEVRLPAATRPASAAGG